MNIYYGKTNVLHDNNLYEEAYYKLPKDRKNKINKCALAEDKLRSAAAGIILNYAVRNSTSKNDLKTENRNMFSINKIDIKQAVKEYDAAFDYEVVTGHNGKPEFLSSAIFFNLTHTGDIVACVIGDTPNGIDMEGKRSQKFKPEHIAKRFFSEEERVWVTKENVDSEERFYRLWTLKEACTKMSGEGIALGINKITFKPDKNEENKLVIDECDKQIGKFDFCEIEIDGYRCSVVEKCLK